MKHKELLEKYFEVFSNKDLESLSEMFSEDVTLIDWENNASSKEEVLAVNRKIFESTTKISVTPIQYYESVNSYAVKIEILVTDPNDSGDGTEDTFCMNVLDIISFDDNDLIKSVEAYLR